MTGATATTESARIYLESLGIKSRQDLETFRKLMKSQSGSQDKVPEAIKPFKPLIEPLKSPEPILLPEKPRISWLSGSLRSILTTVWYNDQVDATVLLTTGFGVIICHWATFSESFRLGIGSFKRTVGYEVLFH